MLKEQLLKARKAAHKTQREVADYLGISESTYCGYEKGKRQPDALKIKKIAAFLNVTGDYLLETDVPAPQLQEVPQPQKTVVCTEPDEIHLVECYRSLNNVGKSVAISEMEGLASNIHLKQEKSNIGTA